MGGELGYVAITSRNKAIISWRIYRGVKHAIEAQQSALLIDLVLMQAARHLVAGF